MKLLIFIVFFTLTGNLTSNTEWSHLDNFESHKTKFLSTWAIEDKVIKYCISIDEALKDRIVKKYIKQEIEFAINSWLNNETIKNCGVYNSGQEVKLNKVKIKEIKNCSDELSEEAKSYTDIYLSNNTYIENNKRREITNYGKRINKNKHIVIRIQLLNSASCHDNMNYKYPHIFLNVDDKMPTFINKKNKKIDIDILKTKTISTTFSTLLHEFGHAFGLADNYINVNSDYQYRTDYFPADEVSIMHPSGGIAKDIKHSYILKDDDIVGLLTIYDRLTNTERIYIHNDEIEKKISLKEIRLYSSENLYLHCNETKNSMIIPLLKKAMKKAFNEPLSNCEFLLKAIERNDIDLIKYLIENKEIDINCTDKYDYTPLFMALRKSNFELAKYLIKQGVVIDTDKHYAIEYISYRQYNDGEAKQNSLEEIKDIIIFLQDNGANIKPNNTRLIILNKDAFGDFVREDIANWYKNFIN